MPRLVSPILGKIVPDLGKRRHRPVPWLQQPRKKAWEERSRQMILLPGRFITHLKTGRREYRTTV